jgi:hypothetical protein
MVWSEGYGFGVPWFPDRIPGNLEAGSPREVLVIPLERARMPPAPLDGSFDTVKLAVHQRTYPLAARGAALAFRYAQHRPQWIPSHLGQVDAALPRGERHLWAQG